MILALLKFSTSPNMLGDSLIITLRIRKITSRGVQSFTAKYGKNLILSKSGLLPRGFEDPVLCNIIRWTIAKAAIKIGIKK